MLLLDENREENRITYKERNLYIYIYRQRKKEGKKRPSSLAICSLIFFKTEYTLFICKYSCYIYLSLYICSVIKNKVVTIKIHKV